MQILIKDFRCATNTSFIPYHLLYYFTTFLKLGFLEIHSFCVCGSRVCFYFMEMTGPFDLFSASVDHDVPHPQ